MRNNGPKMKIDPALTLPHHAERKMSEKVDSVNDMTVRWQGLPNSIKNLDGIGKARARLLNKTYKITLI